MFVITVSRVAKINWVGRGKILGGLKAKNFLECVAKCGGGWNSKTFYRVDGIKHFRKWIAKQSVGMVCQKDILSGHEANFSLGRGDNYF